MQKAMAKGKEHIKNKGKQQKARVKGKTEM